MSILAAVPQTRRGVARADDADAKNECRSFRLWRSREGSGRQQQDGLNTILYYKISFVIEDVAH